MFSRKNNIVFKEKLMFRDEMDFTCMHKPRVLCRTRVQEGSDNEEEEREEEEENTDYLTDSNKENETDEENNVSVRRGFGGCSEL